MSFCNLFLSCCYLIIHFKYKIFGSNSKSQPIRNPVKVKILCICIRICFSSFVIFGSFFVLLLFLHFDSSTINLSNRYNKLIIDWHVLTTRLNVQIIASREALICPLFSFFHSRFSLLKRKQKLNYLVTLIIINFLTYS